MGGLRFEQAEALFGCEAPGSRGLGLLWVLGLGFLGFGFRVLGFLGFWVFGFLGFWVFGFLGFWVFGFLGFWGLGFWVFGA